MYTTYRAEMADTNPRRRRVPRTTTRRRFSDPYPFYSLERYRPSPYDKDRNLAFFVEWNPKPTNPLKPEGRQPKPEGRQPKPEVPKPELAKKLHVTGIDLHIPENTKSHHTDEYDCTEARKVGGKEFPAELVIRRGQEFKMTINLDRPYDIEKNDITLIFKLGDESKLEESVKLEESTPPSKRFKRWRAFLVEKKDKSLTVSIFTPAKCPVGEWELCVRTIVDVKDGKDIVWQYLHNQEITILFNPWCKQDLVYMEDEEWRNETVLNDYGCIYIGSCTDVASQKWFFGQFEDGILNVSLHILRKAFDGEASAAMGNVMRVVRALSAIVNSNDDAGVLSGNWSGNYGHGTNPSDWVGSVMILKEYAKTRSPVKYGQCWVYSGVLTTVCRALGIPCRSVTNFESAHNSDLDHLSCDVINRKNKYGEWCEERADSIWNFHVWNEVWICRPDLPSEGGKNYNGWQVIDATPQERSDGIFQCGPCPLQAIKEGDLPIGLDTAFIFAEVNGDKVEWTENPKTKVFYQIEREKDAIGKCISTHKPTGAPVQDAEMERLDITNLYKYEEGSPKERAVVRKAERMFRCANIDDDESDNEPPSIVAFDMNLKKPEKVSPGETIPIELSVLNTGNQNGTVALSLEILYVDYKRKNKGTVVNKKTPDILLKPRERKELQYEMDVATSLKYPEFGLIFKINAVMEMKDFDVIKKKSHVLRLTKPKIEITGSEKCGLEETMDVICRLTNPLAMPLTNCVVKMEGGMKLVGGEHEIQIGTIRPKETWSKKLTLKPNKFPKYRPFRCMQLTLSTKELGSMYGNHNVRVKQPQQ